MSISIKTQPLSDATPPHTLWRLQVGGEIFYTVRPIRELELFMNPFLIERTAPKENGEVVKLWLFQASGRKYLGRFKINKT